MDAVSQRVRVECRYVIGRLLNRAIESPILLQSQTPQSPPTVELSPGHPPIVANPDVPDNLSQTKRGS